MAEYKRHHFVPQFYLRNFSIDPRQRQISLFNIPTGKYVASTSIQHQAQRSKLYGADQNEKALSDLEGVSSRILTRILDRKEMPKWHSGDHLALLAFVLFQAFRTPTAAAEVEEMVKLFMSKTASFDERVAPFLHDLSISVPDALKRSLQNAALHYPIVMDLRYKLLMNQGPSPFVTSDHPVVFYNQFMERRRKIGSATGLACKGLQLFLPLSPACCLILFDPAVYRVGGRSMTNVQVVAPQEDVAALNLLQAANAGSQLFFSATMAEREVRQLVARSKSIRPTTRSTVNAYRNDKALRTIVLDTDRSPLVRKAFELYASGSYTLDRLVCTMNDLGLTSCSMKKSQGKPLSRAQLHRLLRNPLYCGIFRYKGELYDGKHEPIITRKLFDMVQVVIGKKTKPKAPRLKPYLYRGLFRCGEDGCFITTETHKGRNYLRCTKRVKKDCSQPYAREDAITAEITQNLSRVALCSDDADWLIEAFRTEQQKSDASIVDQLSRAKRDVQEVTGKIDRLTSAYLDQALTLDDFQQTKNRLIEERQHLRERLAVLEQNRGIRFEPAIRFVNDLKQAGFLISGDDFAAQRDLFKKTGSNLKIEDRKLKNEFRDAWKIVAEQGSFARHNPAPEISGAVPAGETRLVCFLAESPGHRSNLDALFVALKDFFEQNPGWE